MAVEFRAGQNAPLAAPSVRFTATASVPVDLCALVVDTHLQVASSQDVVFYNQPQTAGVRLDGDALAVEPGRLRPDADRVLCALGTEQATPVDTTLTDTAGTPLATFRIEPVAGETALLCWEIYRRGGDWKIRAPGWTRIVMSVPVPSSTGGGTGGAAARRAFSATLSGTGSLPTAGAPGAPTSKTSPT